MGRRPSEPCANTVRVSIFVFAMAAMPEIILSYQLTTSPRLSAWSMLYYPVIRCLMFRLFSPMRVNNAVAPILPMLHLM